MNVATKIVKYFSFFAAVKLAKKVRVIICLTNYQFLPITAAKDEKYFSSKFIVPKPLKWDMLRLCTLIFRYDIHKNVHSQSHPGC